MSIVDLIFLSGFFVILASMLIFSPMIRAIFWDTIRHPFTPSRVERYDDGEIRVVPLKYSHTDAGTEIVAP
jgi:hypothetical protein